MDRTRQVLHLAQTEIVIGERELVLDLVMHIAGDPDFARLGQGLEPRGDIDTVAIEVAAFDHDIAEIDADA